MIRQYKAFEDLEEPCFLVPEPEWITVTYRMKSIICQWRWDEIKELIPKNLSPRKKTASENFQSVRNLTSLQSQIISRPNSAPNSPSLRSGRLHLDIHQNQALIKDAKSKRKNLLKIVFLKNGPEEAKWYRFDNRDVLDEFLSDANRHGYIERIIINRFFSTKIKYKPQSNQYKSCLKSKKISTKNDDSTELDHNRRLFG
ncbi:hypothetical protein SSS_04569 [Sarcoptes scabiei]|uniref:Uncharacterized protein n=1 Tax=Sarcoptes scabiei TaxID=52283 RepID=A0A834VG62_SARSC|nr:hypothetical protein SSS_04569 [Sarcoptes scabiei]UXI15190.1 Ankyrin repeat and fibronectin type-III domain-containing protein 1 [Sarcoptes scabiei]